MYPGRTDAAIGISALSVVSLAVQMARCIFSSLVSASRAFTLWVRSCRRLRARMAPMSSGVPRPNSWTQSLHAVSHKPYHDCITTSMFRQDVSSRRVTVLDEHRQPVLQKRQYFYQASSPSEAMLFIRRQQPIPLGQIIVRELPIVGNIYAHDAPSVCFRTGSQTKDFIPQSPRDCTRSFRSATGMAPDSGHEVGELHDLYIQ